MTYNVLKSFTDEEFKVLGSDGAKVALTKSAGDIFIPAEINYPTNRVNARVLDGTLSLVDPASGGAKSAKKK